MSKSEQINVDSIGGNIKDFVENIILLQKNMTVLASSTKGCTKSLESFVLGIGSVITLLPDMKNSLSEVKKSAGKLFESLNNSEAIKKFSSAVENGAKLSGNSMKDFKGTMKKAEESLSDFAKSGKDKIDEFKDKISDFGNKSMKSLSNFKDTISGISFDSIKQGLKGLPDKASEGMSSMGETISKNAGSIGTAAGSLLSGGMIAAIALIVVSVVALVEIFKSLMESNQEFSSKVTDAWNGVKEALAPIKEAFINFKEAIFGEDGGDMTPFVETIMNGVTGIIESITTGASLISEIVVGLFEVLTELWEAFGPTIMEYVSGLFEFISGLISGAVDIVRGIFDIIVGLFTGNGETISAGLSKLWEGICGIFSAGLEFVGTLFSTIWEVICGIFAGVGEFFGNVFRAGWNAIKKAFSSIGKFFSNIWKNITKVFGKVGSWFGDKFKAAWNGVKKAFSGCVKFFSNIWSKIKGLFSKVGTAIGNGISGAFKAVVNGVISFASTIINGFIGAINGAIRLINKIPGVEIPVIARVSLPRLASGGVVDAGQMFIAREAGPELVGTMGSRTAVMNNNQIVESVSRGVYDAVASALGANSIGGDWTIQIVDRNGSVRAEDIITAIERRNRRDGKTVIALGV